MLAVAADAKTSKGEKLGILTGILYMVPARGLPRVAAKLYQADPERWRRAVRSWDWLPEDVAADPQAGRFSPLVGTNLCPFATRGCEAACLFTAGRGRFDSVKLGRVRKTLTWLYARDRFWSDTRRAIASLRRTAEARGMVPAVRMNGTSDVRWETYPEFRQLCESFPDVRFYDYTKWPSAKRSSASLPRNYDLTWSYHERAGLGDLLAELDTGRRVAVVFDISSCRLPRFWHGLPVVDGDAYDSRFLDPACVIGLRAKGDARADAEGFVVNVWGRAIS